MKQTEHQIQSCFMQWCHYQKHPAFKTIFAIPNGGARHIITGKKLKAEGVKKGVPDICLAYSSKEHHGLFIEFKSEKGKLSDYQKDWITNLSMVGYKTAVCFSVDDAISEVEEYLK